MSRRLNRIFFGLAAAAAAGVVVVAVVFALGPKVLPEQGTSEIALARLEALRPNDTLHLTVKELAGLDRLANEERERRHMTLWGPRARPSGMPIFLVSGRDGVHAFLGVDPRTGCDLEDKTEGSAAAAFVDVCHGTAYDLSGRPTRGPGIWSLDELVLHVRGGVVYATPRVVIAGAVAVPGD